MHSKMGQFGIDHFLHWQGSKLILFQVLERRRSDKEGIAETNKASKLLALLGNNYASQFINSQKLE